MSSTTTTWSTDTNTKSGSATTFTNTVSSLQLLGAEGEDAILRLFADEGDDNADQWRIVSKASNNKLNFMSFASGAWSNVMSLFGSSTAASVYLALPAASKLYLDGAGGTTYLQESSDGHLEINSGTTLDLTAPTVDLNSSTEFNIDTVLYDLNASGAVTLNGTTIDIDGSGAMQINSSGGTIGIGNDAVAQAMNIGTGAAARVITMGNVTGATQVVLNAGTAGISLASTGAGDITIDSDDTLLLDADGVLELNSSAGAINIGNDNVDQTINIATAGTRTLNVGINDGTDLTTIAVNGQVTIDRNTAGVSAENGKGLYVDFDRTVAGSGTAAHNDIGIDVDVNSRSLGTSSVIGLDIDVVGATTGTHTATGLTVTVGSSDTNYAALFNGGNVGIGTTSPTWPLTVIAIDGGPGDDKYAALIDNQEATAGRNYGLYITGGSNSSDYSLRIQSVADADYFNVRGDGNVGIGTASPVAHLEVKDAAVNSDDYTENDDYWGILSNHTITGAASKEFGINDKIRGIYSELSFTDGVGGGGFEELTSGYFATTVAETGLTTSVRARAIYGLAKLEAGAELDYIYGSSVLVDVDGGTVDADIYGSYIEVDVESAVTGIGGAVYGQLIVVDTAEDPTGKAYGLYINSDTNVDYGLIVDGGNVGIGTTSPEANLQVAQLTAGIGTVTVTSNTTCTGTGTQFLNTFKVGDDIILTTNSETRAIAAIASNTVMTIVSATNVTGSAYTLAGGDRFSVLGNGRVGIGVVDPVYQLTVVATTNDWPIVGKSTLSNNHEGFIGMEASKSGGADRYCLTGVGYVSGTTGGKTDEAHGLLLMYPTDGTPNYFWVDDDNVFRNSTDVTHGGRNDEGTTTAGTMSDERAKDISTDTFSYGLDAINQLAPIKYKWKDGFGRQDKDFIGLGAQSVQKIIPEVIEETNECLDGYDIEYDENRKRTSQSPSSDRDNKLNIRYGELVPALVKAIQELSAKVIALENA